MAEWFGILMRHDVWVERLFWLIDLNQVTSGWRGLLCARLHRILGVCTSVRRKNQSVHGALAEKWEGGG